MPAGGVYEHAIQVLAVRMNDFASGFFAFIDKNFQAPTSCSFWVIGLSVSGLPHPLLPVWTQGTDSKIHRPAEISVT